MAEAPTMPPALTPLSTLDYEYTLGNQASEVNNSRKREGQFNKSVGSLIMSFIDKTRSKGVDI
jgi:hypothetical protein